LVDSNFAATAHLFHHSGLDPVSIRRPCESRACPALDTGKTLMIRSECLGTCGKIVQAVGVAIPPTIREAEKLLFGFSFRFLRPELQAPLSSSALTIQFFRPFDLLVFAHVTSLNMQNGNGGSIPLIPVPVAPFFRSG
jgi:hypothetical protein